MCILLSPAHMHTHLHIHNTIIYVFFSHTVHAWHHKSCNYHGAWGASALFAMPTWGTWLPLRLYPTYAVGTYGFAPVTPSSGENPKCSHDIMTALPQAHFATMDHSNMTKHLMDEQLLSTLEKNWLGLTQILECQKHLFARVNISASNVNSWQFKDIFGQHVIFCKCFCYIFKDCQHNP